ncbi:MAG: glycosyltransferase family 39 protein [Anaerolineales bacterium]|nr:glycosyltransferase family 39 protein [Anaerolineales bacterium]MDW8279239.1 hypothetical protein [Anaerolineales bacterium]
MTKRTLFVLIFILSIAALLSFAMLKRGHPWWDDFASYVMQARAILSGEMDAFVRRNAFTVQNSSYPPGPVAYPWGYPLLLAPVVALFGVHPLALKLVGIAFYVLFLGVFFLLARRRLTESEALLLTGVLAVNPALLLANDLILSDIPFLAVSTLGVWWMEAYLSRQERGTDPHPQPLSRRERGRDGLLLGLVIFVAAFLRTNGILLFVPLMVASLIRYWGEWKTALRQVLLPLGAFLALYLAASLLFPNGQDSYLNHFSMFSLTRLWENFWFYLWLPSWTFRELPGGVVFYPILALFLLFSVAAHWKRDLPLYAYCLATLGLFILWPERQGLRFIYPVLPFLFLFAFEGMKLARERLPARGREIASRTIAGFWSVLLLLSLGTSLYTAWENLAANREINGPFDEFSYDLYEFIRAETPPDAVIVFVRPRALRLFTDRDSFMTTRCEDLPKGDYAAIHEKMGNVGQIPPEQITACPGVRLEEVFNNRRFTVYRINP